MAPEEKPYPTNVRLDFEGGRINALVVGGLWLLVTGDLKDGAYELKIANQTGNDSNEATLTRYEPTFNGNTFLPRLFPLEPGENKFTLIATKNGQKSETKDFTLLGDGFSYKSHGIEIQLVGSSDDPIYPQKLLGELAALIETTNLFLENPIKLVRGSEGIGAYANFVPGGKMLIDRKYFEFSKEKNDVIHVQIVFWHEAAHIFIRQIENEYSDMVQFGNMYRKLKKAGSELFDLFDESSYLDIPKEWGHPYSTAGELFASASSVLHFVPEQFIAKVNELPGEHRVVVVEAAKLVLSYYLNNKNCPKNLFGHKLVEFLGLDKNQDKKAIVR